MVLVVVVSAVFSLPVYAEPALQVHRDRREHRDPPATRHWGRMALETLGVYAVGEGWYFRRGVSTSSNDWELPFGWDTIGYKLSGKGFRYDGDAFDTNGLEHPIFGLTSYEIGRENGLGMLGSFGFATLVSGLWETFGEWREFGAINDLLMTSTSGVPLGEAIHQILHHLRETRLEAVVGLGNHVAEAASTNYQVTTVRTALDTGARRVRLDAAMAFDDAGKRGLEFDASTTLGGIRRGHAFAGISTAFEYRKREARPNDDYDVHAMVGVGPSAAIAHAFGRVDVDAGIDTAVQLGMEKSRAFDGWRTMHPNEFVRGTEQTNEYGYYHALGAAAASHVSARYGAVSVGAYGSLAAFRALRGHDRYQEMITAEPQLADTEGVAGAWLGVTFGRAVVRLDGVTRRFAGHADDARAVAIERDVMLGVGFRL